LCQWGQCVSKEASKSIARHFEKISHLDVEPMLKQLQSTLDTRHAILPDVNKEFMAISQKIVEYTDEWCPRIPKSLGHDRSTSTTADDIFIVNCPDLHPVPGKVLLSSIQENSSMRPQKASLLSVCSNYKPLCIIWTGSNLYRRTLNFSKIFLPARAVVNANTIRGLSLRERLNRFQECRFTFKRS
jgi:hypothetical protein